MVSPWHGNRAPFELPSNVVYFHDWRYVHTGAFGYQDAEGKGHPMWGLEPVPPMRYLWYDMPVGIELVAQRATKSEPFLRPEQAGQIFLFAGNMMRDGGKYRLWYDCWPREHIGLGDKKMGNCNYVRYAESDNGVDWTMPVLNLVERNGSTANNVVYGPPLCGSNGYHGGCVFKDPSAPTGERYKSFYLGMITPEEVEAYRRRRPDAVDPFHLEKNACAVFGAVSPDGLRWTRIEEPLILQTSDTHNVCEYDVRLGRYVAYCRSWYFMRRTIGRMETDDFRRFPLPEELFWPDASMEPYDTWYANGKTLVPGTTDYHVMFPMRWRLTEDRFDFHLATSPDNIVWNLVSDGPICEPGDAGTWDGGVVAPGLGMVELPDGRFAIPFVGSAVPHKHPRRPPLGALGWVSWPKGRLVALRAAVEGSFATWPLRFAGRTVRVNVKTPPAGVVAVEAADEKGQVLPGRSFADCDHISGNHLDRVVTWKGQSDLGHPEGVAVMLRFRMRAAELYSIRFE